eukprot:282507-Hanusia_phi.AAC.1
MTLRRDCDGELRRAKPESRHDVLSHVAGGPGQQLPVTRVDTPQWHRAVARWFRPSDCDPRITVLLGLPLPQPVHRDCPRPAAPAPPGDSIRRMIRSCGQILANH